VRETWAKRIHSDNRYYYKADNNLGAIFNREGDKWRPSIHMPKEAARLFLEVKNVRVERLQAITEEDARAEGILPDTPFKDMGYQWTARDNFIELWDTLYAKRGHPWRDNDWVFVYSFGRIDNYGKN
jgi:hypothetical protein